MDRCTDYRHEWSWWQQEGKGSWFASLNKSVVEAAPRCVWDSWRRWEVLSMIVSVFGSILCSTTSSRVASCEPATAPAFFNESLGILRLHGCGPAHHSNEDSPHNDDWQNIWRIRLHPLKDQSLLKPGWGWSSDFSSMICFTATSSFSVSPMSSGTGINKRPVGVKHLFLSMRKEKQTNTRCMGNAISYKVAVATIDHAAANQLSI